MSSIFNTESIRQMGYHDLERVADIHMSTFKIFFLTFLGKRFLYFYYKGILRDPSGISFIYIENDKILGFIVGFMSPSLFYKNLLRRYWFRLGIASIPAIIKRPKSFFRLLKALNKPSEAPKGFVAELSSFAVLPDYQGKGIGKELINAFINDAKLRGIEYIYLTTDALNNEDVNIFYIKRDFKLVRKFEAFEKRLMCEYKYEIKQEANKLFIPPETARIERIYKKRYVVDKNKYSLFHRGEFIMEFTFERDLIKCFIKEGINYSLDGFKILEVGCGDGKRLRNLQRLGAVPALEHGIELLDFYVTEAKLMSSNCNIIHGDASMLPYENAYFNIIYQRTVFTSIFDNQMKQNMASEMLRVLKPDGFIIWYDFFMDNPMNPDVKAISKKEIYSLFPDCKIYLKRITLAPPIARVIAPFSIIACIILEKIPLFCSHYLGIIRKT